MDESSPTTPSQSQIWYERLNKALLLFVAGELGYLILLGLGFGILAILYYTTNLGDLFIRYPYGRFFLWPFLPLVLALLIHFIGGFLSAVLTMAAKHRGYPGTGHFLNWLFCAANYWLIVIAILFFLLSAARVYD